MTLLTIMCYIMFVSLRGGLYANLQRVTASLSVDVFNTLVAFLNKRSLFVGN